GTAPAHCAARRSPKPDAPTDGMPLPHALPDPQAAALFHGSPAAGAEARRALGGLSFAQLARRRPAAIPAAPALAEYFEAGFGHRDGVFQLDEAARGVLQRGLD